MEIMVAIGVLVIGMLGVLSLFVAAVSSHKRAVEQDQVARLAETLLAQEKANFSAEALTRDLYNNTTGQQSPDGIPDIDDNQDGVPDDVPWNDEMGEKHPDFPKYRYQVYYTPLGSTDEVLLELIIGWGNFVTGVEADDDKDGQVDEDPWDNVDNDGDQLIDEDPPKPKRREVFRTILLRRGT